MSRAYMQHDEFKERQSHFKFFCAKAAEFLIAFRNECRDGWISLYKDADERFENVTLPLPFERKLTHREWARRAIQAVMGC